MAGQGTILRQPATGQLEERVIAEGIGIILVVVITGNLEEALPEQFGERMLDRAGAPVRDDAGQPWREIEVRVGLREPDEAAIRGELRTVERRGEGLRAHIQQSDR